MVNEILTPETALVKALEYGKAFDEKNRDIFFLLLAAASISYIRGSQGDEVLQGFVYAAMQDDTALFLEDIGIQFN